MVYPTLAERAIRKNHLTTMHNEGLRKLSSNPEDLRTKQHQEIINKELKLLEDLEEILVMWNDYGVAYKDGQ